MKALGLALIAIGGGLVVYGVVRKLSAPAAEPGDPDYESEDPTLAEWNRKLDELEERERNAHTSVHDLNDGI